MNTEQLRIEINHILESGTNDVRLIELFERYSHQQNNQGGLRWIKATDELSGHRECVCCRKLLLGKLLFFSVA